MLPITTRYFDCYVTGWNRLLVRIGPFRFVFGRRTRSWLPVHFDRLPRASAR